MTLLNRALNKHWSFRLSDIILLVTVFPYISFRLLPGDLQPYYFLASLVYVYWRYPGFRLREKVYLCPLLACLLLLPVGSSFDAAIATRAVATYATPLLLVNVYLDIDMYLPSARAKAASFCDKSFKIIVILSGLAGLIQFMFGPQVFYLLIAVRTSEGRGVTSIYSEPSLYGLSLCICLLYFCCIRKSRWKQYCLAALVQIVLLSQSSIAIVIAALTLLAMNLRLKYILIWIFIFLFGGFLLFQLFNQGSFRVASVISSAISDPLSLVQLDGSINERAHHILLSLKSWGIPKGFFSFDQQISASLRSNPYFWAGDETLKIMSGFGAAFWEIGFVSLIFIGYPSFIAAKMYGAKNGVLLGICLLVVFANNITFAHPFYSLLVAALSSEYRRLPRPNGSVSDNYLADYQTHKCRNYG